MSITHKQVMKDKNEAVVKYFTHGAEACRTQVMKLINKLSKEYDKSIDIDHLKKEIKDLKISIINIDR